MKKITTLIFFVLFISINIFSLKRTDELKNYFPDSQIPKNLKKVIINDNEKLISEKMINYINEKYKIISGETPVLLKLWQTGGPIINYFELEYNSINFHVIDTENYFLMSLPSGDIFISEGLFYLLANEDELAFLISRELYLITKGLTPEIRRSKKLQDLLRDNKPVWEEYIITVNRINNMEADKHGALAMFKTGYSPWNGYLLLKKLENISDELIDFFDLKNISERIPSLDRYIKNAMPFAHIKLENYSSYRNAYYYFVLGSKFLKANMLDDAIKAFKESTSIKPDIAETHNNLGIAYAKKGFYNQALYHYDIAIKLGSDYRYYFNWAVSAIKMGRHSEAVQYLKRSINENPSNVKAQRLYLSLETFIEEMGNYE
ncbi:MAG: tetratricopeptide repeat protein [Candidatus Muiribacteriota bacterium]|jgi:tetratricopeptide (TPR) repeat protein